MKKFTSKTQRVGEIGEKLARKKLLGLGFKIIESNYTKQGGEIDIIAQKGNNLHFIEVKSVSCEINRVENDGNVTHVTNNLYRPEENLSFNKFLKIAKTIDIYLSEKHVSPETSWQIDLACVYIDLKTKQGKVEILENIIV
ncbi:MAG: putative endonuclease [Patescibacteria group bacterium]|jgi:putative endonuclease|nr:putative endonuclease [Patescibacteria group bacterium]